MGKINNNYIVIANGEKINFQFDLEFANEYKKNYLYSMPQATIEIKQI